MFPGNEIYTSVTAFFGQFFAVAAIAIFWKFLFFVIFSKFSYAFLLGYFTNFFYLLPFHPGTFPSNSTRNIFRLIFWLPSFIRMSTEFWETELFLSSIDEPSKTIFRFSGSRLWVVIHRGILAQCLALTHAIAHRSRTVPRRDKTFLMCNTLYVPLRAATSITQFFHFKRCNRRKFVLTVQQQSRIF